MAQITYDNKVNLDTNADIPRINKVIDEDLNEIKNVVNENDDNVGNLSDLDTTDKSNIVKSINEINSKSMQITELYSGTATSTTTVTLSDNYDNYDMVVAFVRADYNNYKMINWYKGYYGYKQNCTVLQSNGYCSYGYIGLNSNNKCTITSYGVIGLTNLVLEKIIGINFNKVSGDE